MISVENVINNHLPSVFGNNPLLRKPTLGFLRYLFHEVEFHRFERNYPHLKGFDFVDEVLDYFDFDYSVSPRNLECIPNQGRVVIVANHPIGSLDGLALLKMVGSVRNDVKVVANDILSALEPLERLLLPVDAMGNRTAKENIRAIEKHLNNEGAIVIFPAGEVSRFSPKGVRDGRWRSGFLKIAQKTKAPILPVYVDARNSAFFYSLSLLAKPLSTLWLIREMFKHASKRVTIRIGQPVPFQTYDGLPLGIKAKTKLFHRHVYKLAKKKGIGCFAAKVEAVAHPENRKLLREEIRSCELLGNTHDGKKIYLYKFNGDCTVMRELARLRELSFRAVGEGSGKRRDMDLFDSYYDHIVLWDDSELEIVGAYRLVRAQQVIDNGDNLYTQTLFDYNDQAASYIKQGAELGRSFIQPRYWGRRGLEYLWYGIGAYLKRYPDIRYLFGAVSISNSYPSLAKSKLITFYRQRFPMHGDWSKARNPFEANTTAIVYDNTSYQEAFIKLKTELADLGVSVPTLFKQYSELCEDGGVQLAEFNVDPHFSDCIDGLVLVNIDKMKTAKRKRYFDNH